MAAADSTIAAPPIADAPFAVITPGMLGAALVGTYAFLECAVYLGRAAADLHLGPTRGGGTEYSTSNVVVGISALVAGVVLMAIIYWRAKRADPSTPEGSLLRRGIRQSRVFALGLVGCYSLVFCLADIARLIAADPAAVSQQADRAHAIAGALAYGLVGIGALVGQWRLCMSEPAAELPVPGDDVLDQATVTPDTP